MLVYHFPEQVWFTRVCGSSSSPEEVRGRDRAYQTVEDQPGRRKWEWGRLHQGTMWLYCSWARAGLNWVSRSSRVRQKTISKTSRWLWKIYDLNHKVIIAIRSEFICLLYFCTLDWWTWTSLKKNIVTTFSRSWRSVGLISWKPINCSKMQTTHLTYLLSDHLDSSEHAFQPRIITKFVQHVKLPPVLRAKIIKVCLSGRRLWWRLLKLSGFQAIRVNIHWQIWSEKNYRLYEQFQ